MKKLMSITLSLFLLTAGFSFAFSAAADDVFPGNYCDDRVIVCLNTATKTELEDEIFALINASSVTVSENRVKNEDGSYTVTMRYLTYYLSETGKEHVTNAVRLIDAAYSGKETFVACYSDALGDIEPSPSNTVPDLGDLEPAPGYTVSDIVDLRDLILKGSCTEEELNSLDFDGNGILSVGDVIALRGLIMAG